MIPTPTRTGRTRRRLVIRRAISCAKLRRARFALLDCRYASHEQCRYLAVGRSAMRIANPYFAQKMPPRRARRLN
ncbi:DUF3551 domain-containing protein [Bradyrhizobium sp. LB12.1]|uniref:DUF3551 domain-containing protein n=1 Tax=unclassified Bradyrhizobium TaxID=2631580 RepID=UPI0033978D3C